MSNQVLIVEDDAAIAELLSVNLRHAGYTPLVAQSAEQAQTLIQQTLPDVLLLDWMLPGRSGVALAKALRSDERTRDIPIILLTARSAEQDKVQGLEAGADDYITKPFSNRELLARIQAVLRRRAPQLTADTVTLNGLSLSPVTRSVSVQGAEGPQEISMGPTEFRLLHFFMTHPDRVYHRAQLLDQVWGDHVFIEERTVDVHIKRLRAALEPAGYHHRIETVRGAGYRWVK